MGVGIGHTLRNNALFLAQPTPDCRDLPSPMPLCYRVAMVVAKRVTEVQVLVTAE